MMKYTTICRDNELRKRFQDILDSGINPQYYNWNVIVKMLSQQTAPRFYISPKIAEQYVLNYYRGVYKLSRPRGRKMIEDLVENYEKIIDASPNLRKYEIWERLVECQAKSFYINERTIKDIIYEYTRPTANRKRG